MGWDFYDYTPSVPRKAKGGIKAEGKKGSFGKNWWAKQWNGVLESFNLGARLNRGKSYARQGQVLSVEIKKGIVNAKVQGSRVKPYTVKLKVKTLSTGEWDRVITGLAAHALFTTKLLTGEMPHEIETVFKQAGVSLFPAKQNDLETDCSCPDWSNPCKHIAAVYYILGEEFDRDPFLIFKLRGIEREELLDRLGKMGTVSGKPSEESVPSGIKDLNEEPWGVLTTDLSAFWEGEKIKDDIFGEIAFPSQRLALLRKLGNLPFWRGKESMLAALEPVYTKGAELGLELVTGTAIEQKK
ncbi:MAG: hypothetical protein JG781_411 [Peptococcaceae bacterium]|jgi:uncharacterized Zn finger protein|nr:hypothetical protein [Peptococcaceae bacterium]